MTIGLLISLIPFATLVILGVLFLINNPKDQNNRWFSALSFSLAVWVASNYFAEADINISLLWTRIAFSSSAVAAGVFLLFSANYPKRVLKFKALKPLTYFAILAMTFISFHKSFVPAVRIENGVSNVVTGSLYPVFIFYFVFTVLPGLTLLSISSRRDKGLDKQRVKLVLFGAGLMIALASTTNLILPLITGKNPLATIGSYSTLFFVGFTYYAVARHRLLDVRSLVARSLAYLLVLLTSILLYAGIVLALSSLFINVDNITTVQRIIFALISVLLAVTFQPIKLFINKSTNRIFFRESCDSQEVLDSLGTTLARDINLRSIVVKSSQLIDEALNPSFVRFVVFKDGETFIDHGNKGKNPRAIIRPEVDVFEKTLIMRDEASTKEKSFLNLYDSDVLLKLRTNEETVGVILLGSKQSGTIYSKQDVDLLTIMENELSIAVQNSRYLEQIQEFNVKLQKEVEQATSKLRTSNEKLKALDEAKDEFISMASHQLRTPLTSIKGYISMVTDGDAGAIKPEQKRLLDEAFASSQRMVYLIADLLNVSRLRTGKFLIESTQVNLPDIVEQEINQLKPTARARKLKLTFNKPARFPAVMLDETKMRQVVMNFIDNAIYYTPAGGRIEVSLLAKRNTIEYTVTDDGIGVPKDDQPKLFTKFFRAGNARKSRPDGTGLGLYMAQRVVSAQGGSIIFKSTKDKGSTFGFSFPLSKIAVKKSKKSAQ